MSPLSLRFSSFSLSLFFFSSFDFFALDDSSLGQGLETGNVEVSFESGEDMLYFLSIFVSFSKVSRLSGIDWMISILFFFFLLFSSR